MNEEYRHPNVRHGSEETRSQLRRSIPAIGGAGEDYDRPQRSYGNEGGSNSSGNGTGNSPEIGNLTAYSFLINPMPTTAVVVSHVNPQNSGGNVTFMATVTPAQASSLAPTGSVSFYDGSTLLGTATLAQASSSYTATFATSSLTAGSHTIRAVYSGDTAYASSSGTMTEKIAGAAASITVVSGFQPALGLSLRWHCHCCL